MKEVIVETTSSSFLLLYVFLQAMIGCTIYKRRLPTCSLNKGG